MIANYRLGKNGLELILIVVLLQLLAIPASPQGGQLPLTSASCAPNTLSCYWANSTQSCWDSVTDLTGGNFLCYPQTDYPQNRCIKQTVVVRKGTYYCQAYVDVKCCAYPTLSVTNSTSCPGNGEATPVGAEITDVSYSYTCC